MKIAVLTNDKQSLETLNKIISKEHYKLYELKQHKDAVKLLKADKPACIITDVELGDIDGIELCSELKSNDELKGIPVVFYADKADDYTQIAAFQSGAEEFIAKSQKSKLIEARLKLIFKRFFDKDSIEKNIRTFGNIVIDEEQMVITKKGDPLKVSKKEFQLIALLTSKPGKVFKRNNILLKVWGDDIIVGDRNIDTHIKKIRKKLGKNHIETIRGIGYKFIP